VYRLLVNKEGGKKEKKIKGKGRKKEEKNALIELKLMKSWL